MLTVVVILFGIEGREQLETDPKLLELQNFDPDDVCFSWSFYMGQYSLSTPSVFTQDSPGVPNQ